MYQQQKYEVAGHVFSVRIPENVSGNRLLSSYQPFRLADSDERAPLFSIEVEAGDLPETGELIQLCNDEAPYLWIYKSAEHPDQDDSLCFGYSFDREAPRGILSFRNGNDWSLGHLTISRHCPFSVADSCLNNSIMLMYTYNTGWHDTLMLHASAPMKDGAGYVFLACSGTGKSTHSRMWLENIEGTELLNDDNPVVRVINGVPTLYGTPWSGKTPCYKNQCVKLGGCVRIIRAPYNRCTRLNIIEAYASLLPSCSSMKWNEEWNKAQNRTIEAVISKVACWNMECLPDAEAALVCYNAVGSNHVN